MIPPFLARYAKFYVSLVSALLVVLIQFYPSVHWLAVVSALIGAAAVYLIPNRS